MIEIHLQKLPHFGIAAPNAMNQKSFKNLSAKSIYSSNAGEIDPCRRLILYF